jgi:hypothetical protein
MIRNIAAMNTTPEATPTPILASVDNEDEEFEGEGLGVKDVFGPTN